MKRVGGAAGTWFASLCFAQKFGAALRCRSELFENRIVRVQHNPLSGIVLMRQLQIPFRESQTFLDQATKGVRWMPWRWKAMKDVVSCDKPRLAAASLTGDVRMGKPSRSYVLLPPPEYIGRAERTGGIEPSKYPQEEKATAIPKVAASEMGTA